jgi:hypothetical protein
MNQVVHNLKIIWHQLLFLSDLILLFEAFIMKQITSRWLISLSLSKELQLELLVDAFGVVDFTSEVTFDLVLVGYVYSLDIELSNFGQVLRIILELQECPNCAHSVLFVGMGGQPCSGGLKREFEIFVEFKVLAFLFYFFGDDD